jgi:hypothetical protein
LTDELRESFLKAADEIFDKIGLTSAKNYFVQGGDRPIPLKITSRSGSLLQAVLGGVGAIRTVDFGAGEVVMTYGIGHPQSKYAVLLHEGGVRQVTSQMRRFFWAKWHSTRKSTGEGSVENEMWSRLRFANRLIYEPRPFIENAINDIMSEIPEILKNHVGEGLRIEIKKIITEAQPRA